MGAYAIANFFLAFALLAHSCAPIPILKGRTRPKERKSPLKSNPLFALLKDTPFIRQIARINITLERLATTTLLTEGRLILVQTGFHAFLDKPLLGWGTENYTVAFARHLSAKHADVGGSFDQAHSKPLEVLTTTGILGLLTYLSLWVAIIWAIRRRFKEKSDLDNLKLPAKMAVRSPSIHLQVRVGMAMAILFLISLSFYYLNYRPYRAAQLFIAPAKSSL